MNLVRHGISTMFESLPCQSRVAWQILSFKTLIQTSCSAVLWFRASGPGRSTTYEMGLTGLIMLNDLK